ncbi:MAG: DUF3306 domain-containing protein [Proteobacteria bacterium]|nr:DUF3306 domain-containing protein [Pseudomonadota bacterium]
MSEPESFFQRWSRRKRAPADAAAEDARAADDGTPPPDADAAAAPAPAPPAVLSDIELAKLPSLESITATTDITGFLAPGVPAELTRAALRRAWLADPQIRDFVGIAENQWDFTTPGATPGFGELAEDEVRRLVAEVMGETKTPTAAPAVDPEAAKDPSNRSISALPAAEPRPDARPTADAGGAATNPSEVVPGRASPPQRGGEDQT